MSAPRRKPDTSAKQEIDAELPVLQPIEDDTLPLLEPIVDEPEAEGPVKATCAPAGESGFDFTITVDVPEMDKKQAPDAVRGPLQRVADKAAAQLRYQCVLVRFTGDTMVGSGVKEVVAAALKPKKPLKVTVRRGFGDELVHEGTLPKVEVDTQVDGGTTRVTFATADLEPMDLPILLPPELGKLAASAKGQKILLTFRGLAKPDAATREQITTTLRDAGAVRAAIGERVLFDRELEERVKVRSDGGGFAVEVTPAADPAVTHEALQMMLPRQSAAFAGKVVRVHFTTAAKAADQDLCVELCRKGLPQRIEFGDGRAESDVVWPKLLEVAHGNETTVRIAVGGRSRAAVFAAFRREAAEQAPVLRGKNLVIDWPSGFLIDAEAERCFGEALASAAPETVACTIGGEQRESFVPPAVTFGGDGELRTVRLDTDAGKPLELGRAIERRVPAAAATLRGRAVRVQVTGSTPPSRTLLRTLCSSIEAAGPSRLEIEDRGIIDVLLPPMLTVAKSPAGVRLAAAVGGRDEAQQKLALQRELEAADLGKGSVVTVADSEVAEALIAAAVARGAPRVLLDAGSGQPTQVHPKPPPLVVVPPPVAAPAVRAVSAVLEAAPGTSGANGLIMMLARKDDAVPPMLLLGIEAGTDEAHVASVERQLQEHLAKFRGRCVLLVLRKAGQDVPVRRPEPLATMLARVVSTTAAATLVFRGPDAQQRPHFQVLHSTLRSLPVGAAFGDPRQVH